MCLAAFAINASSRWPLVLASNRDEFFDRPALALATWQTQSGHHVISGRDDQAGGSWLAMSPQGRVALLTNVREAAIQARPLSRGELVIDWLSHDSDARSFAEKKDAALYGGFNLVMGDLQRGLWHVWTNQATDSKTKPLQALADGVYGLSNAALDTPWPKTTALKSALRRALAAPSQADLQSQLFNALSNPARAAIGSLPNTGVPKELEHGLSSAHVSLPERNYGTRCASVIVVAAPSGQDALAGVAGLAAHFFRVSFTEASFLMQPSGTQSAGSPVEVNFTVPTRPRLSETS